MLLLPYFLTYFTHLTCLTFFLSLYSLYRSLPPCCTHRGTQVALESLRGLPLRSLKSPRVPELSITTVKTKLQGDAHLVSHVFDGEKGEQITTLLRIDGEVRQIDHFKEEWLRTLERTLPHAEEDAYERLEGALKELNGLLKGTLISGNVREINAVLALADTDGTLHVAQAGRAEAYLTRGGKTVQITEGSAAREGAQFLHISSGALQENDVVILSTERLLRSMSPVQITQIVRRKSEALDTIRDLLEREREVAVLALLAPRIAEGTSPRPTPPPMSRRESLLQRMTKRRKAAPSGHHARKKLSLSSWKWKGRNWGGKMEHLRSFAGGTSRDLKRKVREFLDDLQHPTRKRKAHLLLIAGAIIVFVGIWSAFQISTVSKKSQTRVELEKLVEKINGDLRMAENRQLMGDMESANAILTRAEEEAKGVMQNESGLFRTDALDLLDRIRAKRESINNVVRLSPTVTANLSAQTPDVSARGLIGLERGRLIAYDRQNLYSIIVNAVDEPQRLDGENLILDGAYFERFKTQVFMTKENRLIELIEGQPTAMKTDDPGGWLNGPDMETYLRYLYILSPQNNQILKYERLSNRYSAPSEYNVNGKLAGALDMVIDADLYVLHQGGKVTKLLRGEERPFVIRNLPTGALDKSTKIIKPSEKSNFYFLDPEGKRVVVARSDDDLGESLYLKQFVLEGEQVGTLQDLYVDPEEAQLFVLDEKRLYSINLQE